MGASWYRLRHLVHDETIHNVPAVLDHSILTSGYCAASLVKAVIDAGFSFRIWQECEDQSNEYYLAHEEEFEHMLHF